MTEAAVTDFRAEFRSWLDANLPQEWRDISRGTDEPQAIAIRREWGARLAEGGWGAPQWPKQYGGLGLPIDQQIVTFEELVDVGAPEALNSNGISIFGPILIRHGTEEQRGRYLPPMLDHTELWCQGFSEPNAGSDLANLQTRARIDGDRFIVTGQKLWTSFAGQSDFCYLLVRTDPSAAKHAGISLMILDLRQEGVTIRPVRNIAGGQEFAEVFLDDVVVPADQLVGQLNGGWAMVHEALGLERGLSFAERSMRLRREIFTLLELVSTRANEDGGAFVGPDLQSRIVDLYISSRALHSLVLRVLFVIDQPAVAGALASLAKLYWSEKHQAMLSTALDVLGDRAAAPEHAEWLRAFLFSRGETIYAGTSEVQRNGLARSLGLPGSAPTPRSGVGSGGSR